MISKSTIVSCIILHLLYIRLFNRTVKLFGDQEEVVFVLKQLLSAIITHEINDNS